MSEIVLQIDPIRSDQYQNRSDSGLNQAADIGNRHTGDGLVT